MNTIRRRTPLLLAVAAMILVFAGSATAARLITGTQIKDGSVRAVDVRDRTVAGADVQNDSLHLEDLAAPAARTWLGDDGPPGPRGEQGPAGPRGVKGLRDLRWVTSPGVVLPPGSRVDRFVACPPGQQVLNGGLSSTGSAVGPALIQSSPTSDGSAWHLYIANDTSGSLTAYLWAVCATG